MNNGYTIFRIACITLLWIFLCYLLISSAQKITAWTIFVIILSGALVFIPLYKKYFRNKK